MPSFSRTMVYIQTVGLENEGINYFDINYTYTLAKSCAINYILKFMKNICTASNCSP